ncbi:MAG: glutathione S-transferase family protein [Plesiomonas shigelloides]
MLTVYGDLLSGNCYKIKLILQLLSIPHQWQHVDVLSGETRSAAFLAKNPAGKIPCLQLENGEYLSESNAILHYLAQGSPLIPTDPLTHARVLQWQFFEQYSHEPCIAVARFIARYLGMPDSRRDEYQALQTSGRQALSIMEQQLTRTPYLAGEDYSLADISLYAYTHVADEGGFNLREFPQICAWLARIEAQPGHQTMAQCLAAAS